MSIETKYGTACLDGDYWRISSVKEGNRNKKVCRLVLEEELGRPIKDGYDCHHKDFNKQNDTKENLIEISHSEHQILHKKGINKTSEHKSNISKTLVEKGICKGENNNQSEITEIDAYQIKILLTTTKLKLQQIADCFPRATKNIVANISSGRSWNWVEVPV
jgi:hypothetical protein